MKSAIRLTFFFLTLFYTSNTLAVYKCVEKGQTTYSDRPCSNVVCPEQQRIKIFIPSAYPIHAQRLEKDALQFALLVQRKKNIEDAIAGKIVISGMTSSEVRRSIGKPIRVSESGGTVQWVYNDQSGDCRYVYFTHGFTE